MNSASGNIPRVIAGAMSGTSADGVDVAAAATRTQLGGEETTRP